MHRTPMTRRELQQYKYLTILIKQMYTFVKIFIFFHDLIFDYIIEIYKYILKIIIF